MLTFLTGEVAKFGGTTYAASPMRVLVRDDCIHIVDGDSLHRQLLLDSQCWEAKGKVNLSDIKMYGGVYSSVFLCFFVVVVCVCMCACMFVCACMCVHTCVCMHLCVCK